MSWFSLANLRVRLILLVLLSLLPGFGFSLHKAIEHREDDKVDAQEEAQRLTQLTASHQNQQSDQELIQNLTEFGFVSLLSLMVAWFGCDLFILRQVKALDQKGRRGWGLKPREEEESSPIKDISDACGELRLHELAEIALTNSEQQYRTLVRNFPNGAVVWFDHNLRYTLADGAGLAEIALSKELLEGKTIWEVFPPETSEILEPIYREALLGGGTTFEIPFADHSYLVYTLPVKNEQGDILGGMSMSQDITRRKQVEKALVQLNEKLEVKVQERTAELTTANKQLQREMAVRLQIEEHLRESEERYRRLVELSPETILVHSAGKIIYINAAGVKLFGATAREELIGKLILDTIHPDYRKAIQERIELLQEQGQQASPIIEIQLVRLDGQVIDIEAIAVQIVYQGKPAMQVVIRDITERKRVVEALWESEERFRTMADTAPVLIWMASVDKVCSFFNQRWLDFTGRTLEEEMGNGWTEGIHPEDFQHSVDTYAIAFDARQTFTMEYRLRRFDGEYRWIFDTGIPRYTPDGSFVGYIGTCIDITERKQTEAELQSQAQLLDLAYDTIMVRDVNNRIIFWNQGAVKMYGYSQTEVLGQNAQQLLQTQFPQPLEEIEAQLLRFGRWEGELVHTRANGDRLVVASRWALKRDKHGVPVKILEINNDITERVQAEQELRDSESLIRALYQVTTNPKLSFNQRLQNLLKIGCQYFGLDFGIAAQLKGDLCQVIAAQSPDNFIKVGDVYELRQTFCHEVSKEDKPFSVHQASNSEWCHHPGYTVFQKETYIGTQVLVQGKVYGVLCFNSCTTSPRPFRSVDKELLKLMAQWISSEIERYLAAEELERLRHQNELILNSAGEGICGVDSQGNITFVNPAAAKMLGYKVEELMNQPIYPTLCQFKENGTPHTLEETELYAVLKDGTVQNFNNQVFWRKDGSSFPVECIATPMRERGVREAQTENFSLSVHHPITSSPIVGAVITFRDITERKAIERMKDEFVSVVSHELRTPLTSIRGALGLIAGGLLTTQPQKAQRMVEIAAANTDRLARLINDILDIERIESGKVQMEKEVCDAYELVMQTADDMRAMAHKAEVTLVVATLGTQTSVPLQVLADRDRIIQVLTNLISNAIKFSPANTTIELSLDSSTGYPTPQPLIPTPSEQSPTILFKVKDQGRGIPADKLESIFGRFQQVNSSDSRDKGGTGLGLAICRTIVQQHDGRIWAESQPDEGSTFYFTLPALQISKEASLSPSPPLSFSPSPLVLLCDDETSIHRLVQIMLEERGYRVVTVATGQEAIEQATLLQPSVILLDLLMPDMDGWATMAVLKEQPKTKNIPVIIFSALALEEDKSSHPDVAAWVSKPPTDQSLCDIIEQSLKQQAKVTRILVVEDDLDLARVLTMMFERHGIEAYHAQTGQEAIQLSQRVLPDLLLLDLVLSEGDGYVVAEWLRQHDRLRELPLVVYSAKDLDKAERDRLALGPTEFFTKGRITPEEFEERVIALLNRIVPKP